MKNTQPTPPPRVVVVDLPEIRPEKYFNVVSNAPLASSLLTGYAFSRLKNQGLDVVYVDASRETDLSSFEERLLKLEPQEIHGNLLYQWENTGKLLESLKRIRSSSGAKLSLFGYFPTFFKRELEASYPFVDSIVGGDPYRSGNGGDGIFPLVKKGECAPILGSRGCWGNCTFCYAGRFFPGYGNRKVSDLLDEIEQRLREGFQKLYFVDPCFFPPGNRAIAYAEELSKGIRKRSLQFTFGLECRSDSVSRDTMDPLWEVGLREVFLGVESGSQSVLDRFNKKLPVGQNEKAIALIQKKGIKLSTGFIMFDPEVTIPELRENLSFLQRNGLLNCATNAAQLLSHKAFIYAGAPVYKKIAKELAVGGDVPYFIDYPFHDPKVERICAAMEKEAKEIYQKFQGGDIDKPKAEGVRESIRQIVEKFEELLQS